LTKREHEHSRASRNSGLLVLALLIGACGGGKVESAGSGSVAGEEKVLNVYNWSDYIGPTTLADFEARTGIKVNYDTYDSNEVLETKLLTGRTGYDVVFPSAVYFERQVKAGVFLKLDKSRLPNWSNLDPDIMGRLAAYDPGNEYAINYMWGTVGLGYNPVLVEKALGSDAIDSFSAVFDPAVAARLAQCGIAWLDSPEDVSTMAKMYLGQDVNSEDPNDLAAVEALLTRVRPYVRYFSSSQQINDLASGEICIALTWNGDTRQARARGAEARPPVPVEYVVPKEGSGSWYDAVAIPADAPHPQNAHAFLDFLMEPGVVAAVTNEVGYANGNAASLPLVEAALREDPAVYPPAEVRRKLRTPTARSQEYSRELNRAWTRVKTGQ
jgi:putrescine transport system substrate-binding protein